MNGAKLLTELNTIDWNRLQHAYGPASDIPDQIRALASPEKEIRNSALEKCYGNILHQGTRYSASAAAVPFIMGLLHDDNVRIKEELLQLLHCLAFGYQYSHLSKGFKFALRRVPKGPAKSGAGKCLRAVEEGSELFFNLLDHHNDSVRAEASVLLAYLRPDLTALAHRTRDILISESSPVAQSTMAITLGVANAGLKIDRDVDLLYGLTDSPSPEVQLGAAIGISYIFQKKTTSDICTLLASSAEKKLQNSSNPWNNGDLVALSGIILEALTEAQHPSALQGLLKLLTETDNDDTALSLAESTLFLLFEESDSPPERVNDNQLNALNALLMNDAVWHSGISKGKPCERGPECLTEFGFGRTRGELRSIIKKIKEKKRRNRQP